MRELSLRNGTIRITTFSGERKNISVSGLAKARLLWLFRNFYILDFSVLDKKQQQLVARVWEEEPGTGSAAAPQDLIGTVEGFSAQVHPAQVHPTLVLKTLVPAARAKLPGARSSLSSGLHPPAMWSAVGVLLLGCAIGLGPKHWWTPESHVAEAAATIPVSSTATVLARTSAQSAPTVADFRADAPEAASLRAAEADAPIAALPKVKPASASANMDRDEAGAPIAPPPKVKPPHLRVAGSPKSGGKPGGPDVIIRVSADPEGRPHAFRVLRGDRSKIPAALAAARHWSFQPSTEGCDHLLTFTDRGDASIVQMIE
jgi:hypothetical protein